MILQLFNPDKEYARLLAEPDSVRETINFFRTEAINFIKLKGMIELCHTDDDYNELLSKMVDTSEHIRSDKLCLLQKQFGFFDFRQKKYLNRLIKDLNRF